MKTFLQWTFVVLRYVLKDLRGFGSRQMANEVAVLVGVGCPGLLEPLIVEIEGQGQSLGARPVSVRVAVPLGEQMVLLAPCLLLLFLPQEPACRARAQLLGLPQSWAQGRAG